MDAASKYRLIQEFKLSQSALVNGINYAYVIAPYLYDMTYTGFFKRIIFSLFFSTKILEQEHSQCNLRLFYSCRFKGRCDYDFIVSKIRGTAGANGDYAESGERLSLIQWAQTLTRLPISWSATYGYLAGRRHRLGAALLIAKYLSSADSVIPLLNDKQRLVTFCDAQPTENLITQLAKAKGMRTLTTQHGQYRVLGENNMSPDAEAYANFISDHMLCWGEATRTEFGRIGFTQDRFLVTGWIRQWGETTEPLIKPCTGAFGVMLNGENGKESNLQLIETAKSISNALGLRYLVRLHPLSKPEEYRQILCSQCAEIGHFGLSTYLSKVDFSIAHMSGAVIEMLHTRSPVYLLDDGRLADIFIKKGLSYKDTHSIISKILSDIDLPNELNSRLTSLSQWYNDDYDQDNRIKSAILG